MQFTIIEWTPIRNNSALVASAILEMPSGLRVATNYLRNVDVPGYWCTPVAPKQQNGSYRKIVTFATPEREKAWSALAMAAAESRLQQLEGGSKSSQSGQYADF